MKDNKTFRKFYKRLVLEGVLKSLLWGFVAAFAANLITAFITWFFPVDGLWISLGVFAVVLAATVPVFYFKLFRPTSKSIAQRIDRLGLEERMITMLELENDESYIAMRQREDAMAKLGAVHGRKMKLLIPIASVIAACVLAVSGVSMTTVTALSARGLIDDGGKVIGDILPADPEVYYTIRYEILYGDGEIMGDEDQLVVAGGVGTPVLAVADGDWAFVCWEDGYTDPYRQDLAVIEDYSLGGFDESAAELLKNYEIDEDGNIIITHSAIFMPLQEDPDDDPQDGDKEGEGDDIPKPSENKDGDGDNDKQNNNSGQDGSNKGDGIGGNFDNSANNIVDGEQDYRNRYEEYYRQAMEIIEQGGEVPDWLKEIIESYYGIIL